MPLGTVSAWLIYYALYLPERMTYHRDFTQEDAGNALYWAYQRGVSGSLLRDWVAEYARREGELCQAVVPVRCRWGLQNEVVQLEIFNIRDFKSLGENMLMALKIAHPEAAADFPRSGLSIRRGDVPDLLVTYVWRGEVHRGKIRPVDVWRAGGFAACFCGRHVKDKEIIVRSIAVAGTPPRRLPMWQAALLRLWELL